MLSNRTPGSPVSDIPSAENRPPFNLERIHALVAELEAELANAPPGAPEVQNLRDEIETLKNVLNSPKIKEGWILESLHSVRDSVEGTVLKDSPYVAEIGRILGLI
ncbi:MAG: hypothetical protein JWP38_1448 [Herbaspirillum sp.]|jgi:hypothetical protein|nr:hypothetical protein [Herbaspirillum sp.]